MLLLGSFTFQSFEIPDKIPFPGKQTLVIHKLIGGDRVIDAMGPDPDDIEWSGRFQGGDAVGRARELEAMRDAGFPVVLVCGVIVKTVVVSEFKFEYERPYQGPYTIKCAVVPDALSTGAAGLDFLIAGDIASVITSLGQ